MVNPSLGYHVSSVAGVILKVLSAELAQQGLLVRVGGHVAPQIVPGQKC